MSCKSSHKYNIYQYNLADISDFVDNLLGVYHVDSNYFLCRVSDYKPLICWVCPQENLCQNNGLIVCECTWFSSPERPGCPFFLLDSPIVMYCCGRPRHPPLVMNLGVHLIHDPGHPQTVHCYWWIKWKTGTPGRPGSWNKWTQVHSAIFHNMLCMVIACQNNL